MAIENLLSKIKIISVNVLGSQLAYGMKYKTTEPVGFLDGSRTDGETIFLNVKDNSYKDLVYINLHELLHVLLEHIRRGKQVCRTESDFIIWNLATDHVIYYILDELLTHNDILKHLDLQGIHKKSFRLGSDLKKYPAEVIYRILKDKVEIKTITISADSFKKLIEALRDKGIQPSGSIRIDIDKDGKEKATDYPLKKFIDRCRMYGSETLTVSKEVEFSRVNLDFTKVIQNYLSSAITSGCSDVSFLKRSKLNTCIDLDVLLPSFVSYKLDAVFAVDTSGSISDSMYGKFMGVIKNNLKKVSGDIVFCDTEIKRVMKKIDECPAKISLGERYGAGGTSFEPVFEYTRQRKKRLLVYMTDLCASFPKQPPFKVVWVVPLSERNYIATIPYGKLVWC